MADSLVGDIIEIETTDDHTASTPTWTLVGKTKDTLTLSPNTEVAETRHHGAFAMDKAAVSEAWEMAFSADIVTGTAQLETLDLINTNTYELQGYADSRELSAANPAITVTAYASEADASNDNVKWEVGTSNYLVTVDSGEIGVEDFSTREMVIHSRIRPTRLDAGGSL
jgi:hypothetical protein